MFVLLALTGVLPDGISFRLLMVAGYVPFATTWFGVDCPNADSIGDKLTCGRMLMAESWLLYAAIFFFFSFLIWRHRPERDVTGEHNIAGTTIGVS